MTRTPATKIFNTHVLVIALTFIFVFGFFGVYLNFERLSLLRQVSPSFAGTAPRCGDVLTASPGTALNVLASADKINKTTNLLVPPGVYRYYIYFSTSFIDRSKVCTGQVEVRSQKCDVNGANCGAYSVVSPWKNFRSNNEGILRADMSAGATLPGDAVFHNSFRPYLGPGVANALPWSNEVTIKVDNRSGEKPPIVDMTKYMPQRAGYTYEYKATNILGGGIVGRSRIQMELERNVCGVTTIPWRYTKDNKDVYWNAGSDLNLRYLVVPPYYVPSSAPITQGVASTYQNYMWALAAFKYTRSTDPIQGFRDLNASALVNKRFYVNTTGRVPSKNLSLKFEPVPYLDYAPNDSNGIGTADVNFCPTSVQTTAGVTVGDWKLRVEKVTPAENPVYPRYTDVIRTDQYEGINPIDTNYVLRESWYFARDVGLVYIKEKRFKSETSTANPPNDPRLSYCKDDDDCLSDTIQSPHNTYEIQKAYTDSLYTTPFSVLVSNDGVHFDTNITSTHQLGYYVKIANSDFSGYLEAHSFNAGVWNTGKKWRWVENGVYRVTPEELAPFPLSDHVDQFRVWIPNEVFPTERVTGVNTLPWSNTVVVHMVSVLPTPVPTPVPPTPSPTPTPTPTPTPVPTPVPTPTPTLSPSPSPTRSPSPSPTNSPVPTPVRTNTPVPTATPIAYGCSNQNFYTVHMDQKNASGQPLYTYTKDCMSVPRKMYLNEVRFDFFVTPTLVKDIPFIKTENIGIKDDKNLQWSVTIDTPALVYVLYRKIPGQSIPAWLSPANGYTKKTNDDFSNLNQYLLRKNELGLIGVYDIYEKVPLYILSAGKSSAGVTFGPASDANVNAYSMYQVGIKPVQ